MTPVCLHRACIYAFQQEQPTRNRSPPPHFHHLTYFSFIASSANVKPTFNPINPGLNPWVLYKSRIKPKKIPMCHVNTNVIIPELRLFDRKWVKPQNPWFYGLYNKTQVFGNPVGN